MTNDKKNSSLIALHDSALDKVHEKRGMSPDVPIALQSSLCRLLGQVGRDVLGLGLLLTLAESVRHEFPVRDETPPASLGLHSPLTAGVMFAPVYPPPPASPQTAAGPPQCCLVSVSRGLEVRLETDL